MQARIFTTASFRFTLLYAGIFSLSVLLLAVLMFFSIRSSLQQQVRTHIEAETAQLFGDYRDDGMEELRHDIRERMEKKLAERLYYAVRRPDGKTIFDRLPLVETPGWHELALADGQLLLVQATPLDDDYLLLVAADLSRIQEVERLISNRVMQALAATLLIALLGGVWASKRFLTRVDAMAKTAERIGDGFLSERLALSGSHDEFDQLALTINRMLSRIEGLIANLQHVSTNIAHDLRTPLNRLRQKLERLEGTQAQEAVALVDEILATFGALLRIAEIESGARRAAFAPVDLSACLMQLAEIYQPVAEEQGQTLTTVIAPRVIVTGDAALLTQLFANLIENALIHGGAGCRISITLTADGEVTVADTGPGIPEEARSEVLKPFYRLDRSRSSKGSGLGLHLAQAIAGLHHAKLTLEDNAPGVRVRVRL